MVTRKDLDIRMLPKRDVAAPKSDLSSNDVSKRVTFGNGLFM